MEQVINVLKPCLVKQDNVAVLDRSLAKDKLAFDIAAQKLLEAVLNGLVSQEEVKERLQ